MQTRMFFIGLFALLIQSSYAQLGLQLDLGFQWNKSVFTQTDQYQTQRQVDGQLGVQATFPVGESWNLHARLGYYRSTLKVLVEDFARSRDNYLGISPLLGWEMLDQLEWLAGPYLSFNLFEEFDYEGGWQTIPGSLVDRSGFDAGLRFGCRYRVRRFYVQGYYLHGIADVTSFFLTEANGQLIPVGEKHRQFQVALGYFLINPDS